MGGGIHRKDVFKETALGNVGHDTGRDLGRSIASS